MSNALLLGGTGAMGVYLAEELERQGYHVLVTSRSVRAASSELIEYVQGNPHDPSFLTALLNEKHFDVLVDFMLWTTQEFTQVHESLLKAAGRYVFLSSYRVFADSPILREDSPRLLDVCSDAEYLATDEYALAKARQEDILTSSRFNNYTIVRPSITYSKNRFQLGTYEVDDWLYRVRQNRSIPIADNLLDKLTTMTWAGDVAKMLALLAHNPHAAGETYNVVTSDSLSWREVTSVYEGVLGQAISFMQIPIDRAIECTGKHQLIFDRMYDRVLDNSKVLAATGLSAADLMMPQDGLCMEFGGYIARNAPLKPVPSRQGLMDRAAGTFSNPFEYGAVGGAKYLIRRFLP